MEPIAIVGLGSVLPGSRHRQEFWNHCVSAKDLSIDIDLDRWGPGATAFLKPDKVYDSVPHRRGYAVTDFTLASDRLAIDASSLSQLDRLYQMVLHAGQEAFFDCQWQGVDRKRAGIILGNLALPTESSSRWVDDILGAAFRRQSFDAGQNPYYQTSPLNFFPAAAPSMILGHALEFSGLRFGLDAACASSLYAIKFACDELRSGRASFMLAGGACCPDSLFTQMGFYQLQALSKSGKSRPLDGRSDGLLVGEGAAVFALKRLKDALNHGDRIHGILTGIGLSNDLDGRLMAPSKPGQQRAMQEAYRQAGWQPADVDYIECHATGTPLGDEVEIQSLAELWRSQTKEVPTVLSSLKGNIGHLLTASGAAGLIRVLHAMKEKTLPPTANFESPPKKLAPLFESGPFAILKEARPWEKIGSPRRAALSAFGFGGTNAHLLVEEWNQQSQDFWPQISNMNESREDKRIRDEEPIAIVAIARHTGSEKNATFTTEAQSMGRRDAGTSKLWYGLEQDREFCEQFGLQSIATETWQKFEIPFGNFRIPPNEFHDLLPQQIAMLLAAHGAAQEARWQHQANEKFGVLIGLDVDASANVYRTRWQLDHDATQWLKQNQIAPDQQESIKWVRDLKDSFSPPLTANRVLGSLASMVASRVAREYHCGGMGLTVSNFENSGLAALQVGVNALRSGQLDEVLVGAVDHATQVAAVSAFSALRQVKSCDQQHEIEDGAVALILKTKSKAIEDGNHIYAYLHEINVEQGQETKSTQVYDRHKQGVASGLFRLVEAITECQRKESSSLAAESKQTFAFRNVDHHCYKLHVEILSTQRSHINQNTLGQSGISIEVHGEPWPRIPVPVRKALRQLDQPSYPELPARSGQSMERSPLVGNQSQIDPRIAEFLGSLSEKAARTARANYQAHLAHTHYAELIQDEMVTLYQDCRNLNLLADREDHNAVYDKQVDFDREADQKRSDEPIFDYEACREFAEGQIANVFGPDFAEIDTYPSRVRLPMDRLLLCHRVMSIYGEAKSLSHGTLITEHDVAKDAWYLDHERIPTAIAIEAGQADLLLSAWLGADFHTRGLAYYRLLDAKVTFLSNLPRHGETIRYVIKIHYFFRQGPTLFFRFGFEALVGDRPLMIMEDGCAGFFTPEALSAGRGIVKPSFQSHPQGQGQWTGGYRHRFAFEQESYGPEQLDRLREGNLSACFGPAFRQCLVDRPLTIPGGDLRLVHEIRKLAPFGGWYGIGLIIGEADIHPDDWFLTCHFKDDHVMPGTLMYECCLHTLRIFALRMGWVGELGDISFEPILGVKSQLNCRGQVLASVKKVSYELHIKEMGFDTDAYVIADALMYADDKTIVDIQNMSVRVCGLTAEKVEAYWSPSVTLNTATTLTESDAMEPIFTEEQILEFATGLPSKALGAAYQVFDFDRRMARLPRPPYQLITEVLESTVKPMQLTEGGRARARYLIPKDIWYTKVNAAGHMPFSILLEVGLQACGWMAAYMGSALTSDRDLFFRNLEGTGTLYRPVTSRDRELLTEVICEKISQTAGMMIQRFRFQITTGNDLVYVATSSFGFFTSQALSRQKGLGQDHVIPLPQNLTILKEASRTQVQRDPFQFCDAILTWEPQSGVYGQGRAIGWKKIDPHEWFFKAHFYQDPVMPGSLGIEGLIQLLGHCFDKLSPSETMNPFEVAGQHFPHQWSYRGQVSPEADHIIYDVHVKEYRQDSELLIADGYLWVDGLAIYCVKDLILQRSSKPIRKPHANEKLNKS